MIDVRLLDCTLRDGGYVNNWDFGFQNSVMMTELINQSGADYVEVGFIGDYENNDGHVRFSSMDELTKVFLPKPVGSKLSAMVYAEGYDADNFPQRSEDTVDMIRVIFWKRNLEEGVEYCRKLVDKGYEVGVQLARTDQYSFDEIGDIVEMFNDVHPTAVYVVDSFGTFDKEKMLKYAKIYDERLADDIRLGYHAHNNMQQAYTNAVAFCEYGFKHKLVLDASVLGMGRGAGNLNIELIMNYLNVTHGYKFDVTPLMPVANDYLMPIYKQQVWGYSMPYFLSAITGRNPSFVNYMLDKNIPIDVIGKVFKKMKEEDAGIRYDTELCDRILSELQ